jgi:hypothetical protein
VSALIERLAKLALQSDESKEKASEVAVRSLGLITLGDDLDAHASQVTERRPSIVTLRVQILNALFALSKKKSVEMQFIVGEALSVIGAGHACSASQEEYSAILRLSALQPGCTAFMFADI